MKAALESVAAVTDKSGRLLTRLSDAATSATSGGGDEKGGKGGGMGAGLGKRGGVVHWPVVGQMVLAWVITLPSAGVVGYLAWHISDLFGKNSTAGAIVIAAIAIVIGFVLWTLSKRNPITAKDLDRTNITPELEAERAGAPSPALS